MMLTRALKRMDGEDVFGHKIATREVRAPPPAPAYSSDEGYGTATHAATSRPPSAVCQPETGPLNDWALALQQLPLAPTPRIVPQPQQMAQLGQIARAQLPVARPRKIRGTHGSGEPSWSSGASADEGRAASRAISPWNCSSVSEQSSDDCGDTCDLTLSNLPPQEPRVLQEMVQRLFAQYVPVLNVHMWMTSEGPMSTVTLRSEWDARLAIARIHKKRLDNKWMGRRLELSLGRPTPATNLDVLKSRLKAILLDQKNYTLPLVRLRDAYASRHCCALTTSDLLKLRDTVVIHESSGRLVQLIDFSLPTVANEEAPWKCHIHAVMKIGEEDGSRILTPVFMELSVLSKQVYAMLENHSGILPLLSFMECYEAMFPPLRVDTVRGVALELLLRSVPGVTVRDNPSRHLVKCDAVETSPSQASSAGSVNERPAPRTAPALEPMLALFERELIDLLKTAPKCCIPFSKLIPEFHHHFGRQCRVADYGFTKLPDLLSALTHTILVLGSGSSRVITISPSAQIRRWTSELVRILKSHAGRTVYLSEMPGLYQLTFNRPFSPIDYGVCHLHELIQRVNPQNVAFGPDGSLSLPRNVATPEEKARVVEFAIQAIELLCYTPTLRLEFSRFVPAYHAHFGYQLRISHYGCVKLAELLELVPNAVRINNGGSVEGEVRLALKPAKTVLAQRLRSLANVPFNEFSLAYASQFGGQPLPDMLDATSLEGLVILAGGAIENGVIKPPGDAPVSISMCLSAAAVLLSDRSVRGSSDDYFVMAFRECFGREPDIRHLTEGAVLSRECRRVRLSPVWRTIYRVATILNESQVAATPAVVYAEYTKKYEPDFPAQELGFDNIVDFMQYYREVFVEDTDGFSLSPGIIVPRLKEYVTAQEDFSIQDTPPGQKGSRVFESPMSNIWRSPPASALPQPSSLLNQEKRRIRLAAHFNVIA